MFVRNSNAVGSLQVSKLAALSNKPTKPDAEVVDRLVDNAVTYGKPKKAAAKKAAAKKAAAKTEPDEAPDEAPETKEAG